ncbi:MAG: AEC family transporter, partial [Clostridiales bacterium]|nr:AEC family transporter [Clostridiales bacterium]
VDMYSLLTMQGKMFLMLIVGFILKKLKLVSEEGNQTLTNLLVNLILPCNILYAFSNSDASALGSLFEIALMGVGLQLLWLFLSRFMWKKQPENRRSVLRYSFQFSNAGYLGNPVVEGLYGSEGLVCASVYLLPVRIFLWGVGLGCFQGGGKIRDVLRRTLTHPCVITTAVGVLWMFFPVKLPEFLYDTVYGFSQCLTPVTMLVIGCIMADADYHDIFSKELLEITALRLLVQPFLALVICYLLRPDQLVAEVTTVLVAMPVANTTAILAARYHKDASFAGNIVVFTTLVSMLTIPLFGMLAGLAFG